MNDVAEKPYVFRLATIQFKVTFAMKQLSSIFFYFIILNSVF